MELTGLGFILQILTRQSTVVRRRCFSIPIFSSSTIAHSAGMSEDKDAHQRDVEDDGMDVKHFLAEPGNHPVSVDDFFGDDKSPNLNTSQSESFTRQGGHSDEKMLGKLSGDSHIDNNNAIGPSTACEDYLLDSEFVDKDSECADIPRKSLSFEKSSLETHSDYGESESSIGGVSESSSISNGKPGLKNRTRDHRDQEKEKTERKSPIIYTSQNRRKLQSRLGFMSPPGTLDPGLTSFSDWHRDSEEASIVSSHRKTKQFLSARHTLVRSNGSEEEEFSKSFTESSLQKRSRKPPVRYIDEFTRILPSSAERERERERVCGTPMDEILSVKKSSKHDNGHKTVKSFKHARHEGRYGNSRNNLFASNKDARGLSSRITVDVSKEFSPVTRLDSDSDEDEESDSETPGNFARNGFKNSGDRRKHQKAWSLPEVEKLVDGISQYGVGHWTEIQRLFFPMSTCRTPVDLRDKWRNLLKASNASMQNDQEERDEELTKNGHRQLPIEILQRISELSRLYPYPVKRTPNHKGIRSIIRNGSDF